MFRLGLEYPLANFDRSVVESRLKECRKSLYCLSPGDVSMSTQLLNLLLQENRTLDSQEGWYYESDFQGNTLMKVFSMSPDQRRLYRLYHDVVVYDTTALTNRLNMPLHCFVVIDCNNKTRLIATALTRGEKMSEYDWVLRQLHKAGGAVAPQVLVADEDLAMDSAYPDVFPETRLVNCIWHIRQNVQKHLRPALGKGYNIFAAKFSVLTEALTPASFDMLWEQILDAFGGDGDGKMTLDGDSLYDGKTGSFLKKLHERRFHWAGPWVQSDFTAGIRSTQRVEMTHNLIKMLSRRSKTVCQNCLMPLPGRSTRSILNWRTTIPRNRHFFLYPSLARHIPWSLK